ncbi:MAG: NAD(P)H-dependent oxidoreductase [Candidatus Eremiobacteraeota bacterium]|nr:NAD(P)H-dependent oxidoreductase [Candidatus Eremiobacteraeota bacterium]
MCGRPLRARERESEALSAQLNAALTIAAFAGSLRAGSYNKMLLRNAQALAPAGVSVAEIDISDIPLFNADIEDPPPPPVARMREAIRAADALLIITPEYNWSMSGVTKNVIDWASRPPDDSCLDDKAVGLAGCSSGYFGTARAKIALLPVFVFTGMHVLDEPMVHVSRAAERFDASGTLTDEQVKADMRALLEGLAAFARTMKGT